MKVLWILIAVIPCIGAKATNAQSTLQQFREAVEKVTLENVNKRTGNEETQARCPLARYHNHFLLKRDHSGTSPADVFQALKVLRENGVAEEELKSEEMQEEIKRQTSDKCQEDYEYCDPYNIYRTADGSCNNLDHPNWGRSGVEQFRLRPPVYDDSYGFYTIRNTSFNGYEPLPNPRVISNVVHRSEGFPKTSDDLTLNVFQFGQFLDHDITLTPTDESISDCCENAYETGICNPMFIQEGEPTGTFFHQGYCMNVQRSRASGCDYNQRQQVSDLTSYIDASNVYGSSLQAQIELRDNDYSGFMKFEYDRLPVDTTNFDCTNDGVPTACSSCGDGRCSVVPSLTSYHHLFAWEHNRIAEVLSQYYYDQEQLFQETRRIVIAIIQHIVYDEFLPAFLSVDAMSYYELYSSEQYYYNEYWNPTMSNEFGIAFRFAHTWIPTSMVVSDSGFNPLRILPTEDTFDDTYLYHNDFFAFASSDTIPGPDGLGLWLTDELSPKTDEILENAVRNFLFKDSGTQTAFDLAALNINRGRDHGIPGYTEYVEWCQPNIQISSWFQLTDSGLITPDLVSRLQQVYSAPQDIDLFTGCLAESSTGVLGPTTECILGDQFYSAKYGDRFFYQNTDINTNPYPFTQDQIAEIQGYSMSKLLCNNYRFNEIDSNAFVRQEFKSPCSSLRDLDITMFLPYYKRNHKDGGQDINGGDAGADKRQGGGDDDGENSGSAPGKRPDESPGSGGDSGAGKRRYDSRGVNRAGGRDAVAGKPGSSTGAGPSQRGVANSGGAFAGKRGSYAGPGQRGAAHFGGTGAGKRGQVVVPSQGGAARFGDKRGSVAGSSQLGVARSGGASPSQPGAGARGDDPDIGTNNNEIEKEKKETDALKVAIEDLLEKLKED